MRSKIVKKILPQNLIKDKARLASLDPEMFKELKQKYQDILDKTYS
jgi:hypothetical protein